MNLTVILGATALVGAVSAFWWGLTARPSAGPAHVLVGQPVFAFVAAGLAFFLPDYWVLSTRDKRQAAMQTKAADLIDQLTICVEAGLGFDSALARVATTTDGPLTDELRHTISDIRAGVPRAQALRALSDRTQVVEVRQLVTALLQAQ